MSSAEQKQIMTVKFWGTRGSRPITSADFSRFGGNTSCVEVRIGNDVLVFDGGSGFNNFAVDYQKRVEAGEANPNLHIFLSHPHSDHTMGFEQPGLMFNPAIAKIFHAGVFQRNGNEVALSWGAERLHAELFRKPVSPGLGQLHRQFGKLTFADHVLDMPVSVGSGEQKISVTPFVVPHISLPLAPDDMSVAFRIESGGASLCIMTDFSHEWSETGKPVIDMDIVDRIAGADALIADSMYSDADIDREPALKGFGHATRETLIAYAALAGIRRVFHTHHRPEYDDLRLWERELINAFEAGQRGIRASFAREGETVSLPLAARPRANYRRQEELVIQPI